MVLDYVLPSGAGYSFNTQEEADAFLNSSLSQGAVPTEVLQANYPNINIDDIRGFMGDYWNAPGGPAGQNSVQTTQYPGSQSGYVAAPQVQSFDPSGIYANQSVLQQDIGDVGAGVGQLAGFVGTPVNDGQTLFSALGDQNQQMADMQQGFVGGLDDLQAQVGGFQNFYEDRSGSMLGSLGTIEEQGQQSLEDLNVANRQIQDIQPAIQRTDAAISGAPQGFMPQPSLAAGAPQTNAALAQASQALAGMPNVILGPQGPTFLDPRV